MNLFSILPLNPKKRVESEGQKVMRDLGEWSEKKRCEVSMSLNLVAKYREKKQPLVAIM